MNAEADPPEKTQRSCSMRVPGVALVETLQRRALTVTVNAPTSTLPRSSRHAAPPIDVRDGWGSLSCGHVHSVGEP